MTLTEDQKTRIRARVAAFERDTGVELVTTVVPRCDDYPEIPWKAFALAAAAAALLVLLAMVLPRLGDSMGLDADWGYGAHATALLIVMGTGLFGATLASFVAPLGRLFLAGHRAEGEAKQAAQVLFLEHELFRTGERTALLLLVAGFERRVVLLADRGLRARLPAQALDEVVATVTASLGRGAVAESLLAGIDRLEALRRAGGFTGGSGVNVLPDTVEDADRGAA